MSILILKRNQNLLKIAFTYLLTVYVWVSATIHLGDQRAILGVNVLLPPCKSQGLNSYQVGDNIFIHYAILMTMKHLLLIYLCFKILQ